MPVLSIAAGGTAAAANQAKYESLTSVGFLVRISNDSLLAIADTASSNIMALTTKSNVRIGVQRSGSLLTFAVTDSNEGSTAFAGVSRASLTAGAFCTISGFRRTGDGTGTIVSSELIIRQAGATLSAEAATLNIGALPTSAGSGALTLGGAVALDIDAAYVYNRRITTADHDIEPTTGSSGLVGGYAVGSTVGTTTPDLLTGTALTLTSATLVAGGSWDGVSSVVRTTAATGNFASGSTWVGGVVPGASDRVVIADGHTLTIAANTSVTLGDPANPTAPAISSASASGTGILVVGAGATLTLRGNVSQSEATWIINSAADIRCDHPTHPVSWTIGQQNGTVAVLSFVGGTGAGRIQFRNIGAARWGTIGAVTGNTRAGQISATGVTFTNAAFRIATNHASFSWSASQCLFVGCDGIKDDANFMNPGASFTMDDCTYRAPFAPNALGSFLVLLMSASVSTGVRRLARVCYEGCLSIGSVSTVQTGFTLTDVVGRSSGNGSISPMGWYGGVASWTRVLLDGDTTAAPSNGLPSNVPSFGTMTDTVTIRRGALLNPHFLESTLTGNLTVDGMIQWTPDIGSDGGDAFQYHGAPAAPVTLAFRRVLNLPGGTGVFDSASGSMISGVNVGNSNISVLVEKCTAWCGTGPILTENYSPQAGHITPRSNIYWRRSTRASTPVYVHAGTGTPSAGSIVGADYNCGFNVESPRYQGYTAGSFASPATPANDRNVNPQFVDDTRNPLTWAQSLDAGITTVSQVIDRLMARNDDTGFDSRFTVAALNTWVRAGFVPTNALLQAAHDAGWIGSESGTTAPVANALRFVGLPDPLIAGTTYELQVEAIDTTQGNVRVTSFTGNVTIGVDIAVPSGYVISSGTLTRAAVAGLATFPGIVFAAGTPPVIPPTSILRKATFSSSPSSVQTSGALFTGSVIGAIRTLDDQVDTSFNSPVQLVIRSGAGSVIGNATVTAAAGLFTFAAVGVRLTENVTTDDIYLGILGLEGQTVAIPVQGLQLVPSLIAAYQVVPRSSPVAPVAVVQVTGPITGGTLRFEGTANGINWAPIDFAAYVGGTQRSETINNFFGRTSVEGLVAVRVIRSVINVAYTNVTLNIYGS